MPAPRPWSPLVPARGAAAPAPQLEDGDISPRLVVAYHYSGDFQDRKRLPPRAAMDYELEFILDGGGSQVIDGVDHTMESGLVVFRRPGQATQGRPPYSCFSLFFDPAGRWLPRPSPYFRVWSDPEGTWDAQPRHRCPLLDAIPAVCRPERPDSYRAWFETALRHHISPGEASELLTKALLLQILYQLANDLRAPLPAGAAHRPELQAVLAYMRKHLRRKLPLAELARVAGLSPSHFQRVFSAALGESPLDHLQRLRVDQARGLLASTDLPAAAVARECGFPNPTYFFTLFRRRTGDSPAAFRAKHRFLP